jgi:F-type H+-transporting ATPase subunit delta
MAEITTIARPYAKAVFELAQSEGRFKEWSDMLGYAAAVVADPQMRAIISNPSVANDRLADLLVDICNGKLDDKAKNMINVLVENDRLIVLPEITALYDELRAEAEKTIEAELTSAFKLGKDLKQKITDALRNRLQREVNLTCKVDETLIGGAVIKAGDLVIDGSVKAKLNKLAVALSS